jgi:hypothetical protein
MIVFDLSGPGDGDLGPSAQVHAVGVAPRDRFARRDVMAVDLAAVSVPRSTTSHPWLPGAGRASRAGARYRVRIGTLVSPTSVHHPALLAKRHDRPTLRRPNDPRDRGDAVRRVHNVQRFLLQPHRGSCGRGIASSTEEHRGRRMGFHSAILRSRRCCRTRPPTRSKRRSTGSTRSDTTRCRRPRP